MPSPVVLNKMEAQYDKRKGWGQGWRWHSGQKETAAVFQSLPNTDLLHAVVTEYTVIVVQNKCDKVHTKTIEDNYFSVQLKQTRLVSSLIYDTPTMLVYFPVKMQSSCCLNSKGYPYNIFLIINLLIDQKILGWLRPK